LKKKKRIAVWTHGGVGTGHFSQGYPLIEKILRGLSQHFELVIYTHASPNVNYTSSHFIVKSAPSSVRSVRLRWLLLLFIFFKDHVKNRYRGLFAFWGYPAGIFVVALARLLRIPSMVNLLGGDSVGIHSIRYGVMCNPTSKRLALWAYERATKLTVLSVFQKEMLKRQRLKNEPEVIPWGSELAAFPFLVKSRTNELRIIHIASLNEVKDQTTLLQAFKRVRKKIPATLRIIGADYMDGKIHALSNELGLGEDVVFLGIIPYDQVPLHLAWADVMMHTSLSEGQSLALTEAAMSGVLLAGTRVGLIADLGSAGSIDVDIKDFEKLADDILSICDNREQWDSKIQYARQWAVQHDLDWTIATLAQRIEDL
jgi:glycosyltransferase involved in cell wall biosynthesis